MESSKKLFTAEFASINLIVFLNYCNIALFFYFTEYLSSISIPAEWWGLLISVFSLVILVMRPLVSPFSNAHNSRKWLFWSTLGVMAILCLYGFARGVVSMTFIRVLHGLAYVVMTVAITSRMVVSIPRERSSLAFSVISVISLLPYAVVPPLVIQATDILGSFPAALMAAAVLMGLTFPLMTVMPDDSEKIERQVATTLSLEEIKSNFKNASIVVTLLIAVVVWTAYAPVFFFLNKFGNSIGVSNPGFFFTISSVAEIVVRLVGGGLMDKGNKPHLLMAAVLWLAGCYAILGFVSSANHFFLMGLFMGIGWGLIMPLLSSIVFDISEPRFRAFNTNITFQMFQMGFFVGPIVGAYFMNASGLPQFFVYAAVSLILSVAPAFWIFSHGRDRR